MRTYPGKACMHLAPDNSGKACAVYVKRPHACERYKCVWLQGILADENMRPDISGIIVGFYDLQETGKPTSATITICDIEKSGDIGDINNNLGKVLSFVTQLVNNVKIVNYKTRGVLYLSPDGNIHEGRLTKPSNPESLEFTFGPSIGKYHLKEVEK